MTVLLCLGIKTDRCGLQAIELKTIKLNCELQPSPFKASMTKKYPLAAQGFIWQTLSSFLLSLSMLLVKDILMIYFLCLSLIAGMSCVQTKICNNVAKPG